MASANVNHYADATHGKACTVRVPETGAEQHVTSVTRAWRWYRNKATFERRHNQREVTGLLTYDGQAAPACRLVLGPFGGVQKQPLESAPC